MKRKKKFLIFSAHPDDLDFGCAGTTAKLTKEGNDVVYCILLSQDPWNCSFDSFGRFHRDHRITAEIVFDAIYPGVGSDAFFPELAQEEIPPDQIEEVWFYSPEKPTHYVNIISTIGKKTAALASHESQIRDMKEMEKRLHKRARDFGEKKGWEYAEAFRRLTF